MRAECGSWRARFKAGVGENIAVIALAVACTVAATGGFTEASARVRRGDCFNDRLGRMGREGGEKRATRLFDQMWTKLRRDCSQLDRLVNLIAEMPLQPPSSRGAYQACNYLGYTEKLFDLLDKTAFRCEDACFNAGADIGRLSATGYCYASMALDGLDDPGFIMQPDLPICGFNVVMGCKSQYIETAVFEIPACRMYTENQFEMTFDNTVRQDCYVPTDVPVRDGFARYSSSTDQLF